MPAVGKKKHTAERKKTARTKIAGISSGKGIAPFFQNKKFSDNSKTDRNAHSFLWRQRRQVRKNGKNILI